MHKKEADQQFWNHKYITNQINKRLKAKEINIKVAVRVRPIDAE